MSVDGSLCSTESYTFADETRSARKCSCATCLIVPTIDRRERVRSILKQRLCKLVQEIACLGFLSEKWGDSPQGLMD